MKLSCPECKSAILLDESIYDDGDELLCPKCDNLLNVIKQNKKLLLSTSLVDAFDKSEDSTFLLDKENSFGDSSNEELLV